MSSTLSAEPLAELTVDTRLVDAALRCVARWGVTKTSLDDVAKEAGCSRATVYRAFPGGKDALFDAVLQVEVTRFFDAIRRRVEDAPDLGAALVAAMTEAGRTIAAHGALQYMLEHEPGLVLPQLAFRQMDDLLETVRRLGAPLIAPFLGGDTGRAGRLVEWVTRITLSYTLSPAPGVSTADEASVRSLVETFVLPGIENV